MKYRLLATKLSFFGILFIAAYLRLYKLESIPNGFYVDEAAIGYNSYSLLVTGKDEWGKDWPIFLRSFEAYSSPLYSYITMLFIKLWGLSIFSVRVLSAISGVFTTTLIYFLSLSLKLKKRTAFFGAAIFAVSPWSVFFSRGAFEANLALFILLLSLLFFVFSVRNSYYYIAAFSLLALSTYAYQAERLLAILLIVGLVLLTKDKKKILENRYFILGVILFFLISLPQLILLQTPAFGFRALGLFYSDVIREQSDKLYLFPQFLSAALAFTREFLSQYTAYFSPKNLFFLGDADPQRSVPELGLFFPWLIIPYAAGLVSLVKRISLWENKFIVLLLVISPVAAALTKDPFSSLRALTLIVPMILVISLGFEALFNSKQSKFWYMFCSVSTIISLVFLWRSYFVLFPYERGTTWQSQYPELIAETETNSSTEFIIESRNSKPLYILHAFYTKLNPQYLHSYVTDDIANNYYELKSFDKPYKINNVTFRGIKWEEDIYHEQILVGDALSISIDQAKEHALEKAFEIYSSDGEVVYIGYRTNPSKKCKLNPKDTHCKQ